MRDVSGHLRYTERSGPSRRTVGLPEWRRERRCKPRRDTARSFLRRDATLDSLRLSDERETIPPYAEQPVGALNGVAGADLLKLVLELGAHGT